MKTQSLIIGSRPNIQKIEKQAEAKPSFEIGDQKINMITDTKYLLVQIDDKLSKDRHIEQVKAKGLRALGLIKHANRFPSMVDLQKMYRGIVEAHFTFVARFGVVVVKANLISPKISRQGLQEYLQIALTMLILSLCSKTLAGHQLKIVSE